MAKISAHGEGPFGRYVKGGVTYMVTEKDGKPKRLLRRFGGGRGYTLLKRFPAGTTAAEAVEYVEKVLGATRTSF